jgi:5'-methylthioadenosine phosphorylase
MGRLGIAGGNATRGVAIPDGDWAVIQRHGDEGYALPHEIDHEANVRRLRDAGCERVLALGSVGGLRPELGPGTFLCPDDFIALDAPAVTALTGEAAHRVPGFDPDWRRTVVDAWGGAAEPALRDGGIYWQANGPRLETQAEIRLIAEHAHVIGMTIATECVVAGELGLAYAAVCVVDNLANGVGESELTIEELDAGRAANRDALERALAAVLPELA